MTQQPSNFAQAFAPVPKSLKELKSMRSDMGELLTILSWARKHNSEAERQFITSYLLPRLRDLCPNVTIDGFGNIWAEVPNALGYSGPAFLWSCHVDTVHAKGGRQAVRFAADGKTVELVSPKPGRCLGADDGAGVWLLLEMIAAGVSGTYVFHRGEEVGRLGSQYVLDQEPDRLKPFDACVAFDRRDFADMITHQMGLRCASNAFAETFGDALNATPNLLAYVPDDGGSYTDSYTYEGVISECANVSVGYDSEHGPRETLDALHLWRLRSAIVTADLSTVAIERDCTVSEYAFDDYPGWHHAYGTATTRPTLDAYHDATSSRGEKATLLDLINDFPEAIADMLLGYGIGVSEVLAELTESELSRALARGTGTGWAVA